MAYHPLLVRVGFAAILVIPGCSSDDSDDDSPGDDGGTSSGATGGTSGSAGTGTGGTAGTGGSSVDCPALCERVRTICGAATIDDNWVSVCTSACDARVRVAPDTAELEDSCVRAAADCTTAVLCVASPTGSGGSG